jgi:serine protease inhibitor
VDCGAFGISLLQRLIAQSHSNKVFISPVNVGVALAMVAASVAGTTRECPARC